MTMLSTGRRIEDQLLVYRRGAEWRRTAGNVFRCMVHLVPEEDGRLSAIAATLPGVASQGATEEEALANVTEALAAALATYAELRMPIPWTASPPEREAAAQTKWVIVHV